MMKRGINIIAGFIVLMGTAWFLQGINVLPGSLMTGQPQWAVAGVVAWIIGIGLFLYNRRRMQGDTADSDPGVDSTLSD